MRRKLTLIDAQNIALEKGGQCLSEGYINNKSPLQIALKKGAPLERIRNHNSWCPKCVIDTRRVGLDLAKNIARSRNGKCLSDE
ncbi:hypothetical protein C1645_826166 [Glomus cerebriforme]|uniref:Uncharacterized protein n=1 Tax=Glomus cerebriforme TaxID=658196 RepID=A0A397SX57_9GLOM|nr:hypothetical protein C1645_826166 [Glomus cerebriforme]